MNKADREWVERVSSQSLYLVENSDIARLLHIIKEQDKQIEAAPHDVDCITHYSLVKGNGVTECSDDCWKKEA